MLVSYTSMLQTQTRSAQQEPWTLNCLHGSHPSLAKFGTQDSKGMGPQKQNLKAHAKKTVRRLTAACTISNKARNRQQERENLLPAYIAADRTFAAVGQSTRAHMGHRQKVRAPMSEAVPEGRHRIIRLHCNSLSLALDTQDSK